MLATSCSSAGLKAQRIDPPGVTMEAPIGMIEDAATLSEDHLFSDIVAAKIASAVNEKADPKAAIQNVQAALCDGKRPRVSPSYKIHLIVPKPPKGTPTDDAAKARMDFIKIARDYLKNHYLYSATVAYSDPKTSNEMEQGSFALYFAATENREVKGNRYSLRGLTLALPVVFGQNRKEVEAYYSNLRLLPNAHGYGRDYHYDGYFKSIVFPKEHTAILAPQVFTFVGVGWERYYGKPLETNLGLGDATDNFMLPAESIDECKPTSCRHTALDESMKWGSLAREARFTVSSYGWKIDGLKNIYWGHPELSTTAPLYPLHPSSMSDLRALMELFVISLPKETICKVEFPNGQSADGPDGRQHIDCATYGKESDSTTDLRSWGYDYDSGTFSGKEAVAANSQIWEKVLANQTLLKEAVQPDNSVLYELGLDLSLFCQYGVPVSDLVSQ